MKQSYSRLRALSDGTPPFRPKAPGRGDIVGGRSERLSGEGCVRVLEGFRVVLWAG